MLGPPASNRKSSPAEQDLEALDLGLLRRLLPRHNPLLATDTDENRRALRTIAIAIVVVLVRYVLAGSAMDISHSSWMLAPGVLGLSMGCGLLSRAKLPYLADSMAVAILAPARGWLCDASLTMLPPS